LIHLQQEADLDQRQDDVFAEYEATARMALLHAQRVASLWEKPILSDDDVPLAVGLAPSTWHAIKARGEGPVWFNIGRRRFVLTADLRAWLDALRAKAQQTA
jgi:hypothetical protein